MTSELKKIGIAGLNNAGKTSMIRTLQHRYKIGENLLPTKGVEREYGTIFSQKVSIWDYGGQEAYRNNYLANPDRYFSDLGYFFFVIDVQDSAHFPDAVDYFAKTYYHAKDFSSNLIVVVLFHKFDPAIKNNDVVKKKIDGVKKEIQAIVEGADISFFHTSIYDPLSILKAYSKPILGDRQIYNAISVLFANYGLTNNIEYMNLLIDDLLEVGSFKVMNVKADFIEASLKFYQQFTNLEIDQKFRSYEFEGYNFTIVRGQVLNYSYLLSIAQKTSEEINSIDENNLAKILTDIEDTFRKYMPKLY